MIDIPAITVSVNNQYEPDYRHIGSKHLTLDAKVYREIVGWEAKMACKKQGWKMLGTERVRILALYIMPEKSLQDVQNDKLTWDALEGIVYKNDRQIKDIRSIQCLRADYQRTIIFIEKIKENDYECIIQELVQKAESFNRGESEPIQYSGISAFEG